MDSIAIVLGCANIIYVIQGIEWEIRDQNSELFNKVTVRGDGAEDSATDGGTFIVFTADMLSLSSIFDALSRTLCLTVPTDK